MEGSIDEGKIQKAIDALSLDNIDKITEKMKTCICKVYAGNKLEQDSFVEYRMKVRVFLS